jgi:hypothetical protein
MKGVVASCLPSLPVSSARLRPLSLGAYTSHIITFSFPLITSFTSHPSQPFQHFFSIPVYTDTECQGPGAAEYYNVPVTKPEAPLFQHELFRDARSQIRLLQVLPDLTEDGHVQLSMERYSTQQGRTSYRIVELPTAPFAHAYRTPGAMNLRNILFLSTVNYATISKDLFNCNHYDENPNIKGFMGFYTMCWHWEFKQKLPSVSGVNVTFESKKHGK